MAGLKDPPKDRRHLAVPFRVVSVGTGALATSGTLLGANAQSIIHDAAGWPAAVVGAAAFGCGVARGPSFLRRFASGHRDYEVRFAGLAAAYAGLGLALSAYLPWRLPGLALAAVSMVAAGAAVALLVARLRPPGRSAWVHLVVGAVVGGAATFLLPGLANGVAGFAATRVWQFGRPDTSATARAYLLSAALAGIWLAAVTAGAVSSRRSEEDARSSTPPRRRHPRALLEVADVAASYGPMQVLFGVSLRVNPDECVALLGTNGSGKSTLLRAIFGLLPPDTGRVWLGPDDVTGRPAPDLRRAGMVLVPGGRGVFPSLTVLENLRVAAYTNGNRRAFRSAVERVIDTFPLLGERLGQPAGLLSGGEQQMLALSRAWIGRPRLLAIDELTLGLAPSATESLVAVVERLRSDGIGILLVEQSVNTALRVAERAYFLERGEVRFEGPTAALLRREDLLRSVFLEGAARRQRRTVLGAGRS